MTSAFVKSSRLSSALLLTSDAATIQTTKTTKTGAITSTTSTTTTTTRNTSDTSSIASFITSRLSLLFVLLLLLTCWTATPAFGSEFPERECCDSPPPTDGVSGGGGGSGAGSSALDDHAGSSGSKGGNKFSPERDGGGGGSGHHHQLAVPSPTTSSTSTEVVVASIDEPPLPPLPSPPLSGEHPDTSNFLFPEFIPELSLDLGYPVPPPPLLVPHYHPHPSPDGTDITSVHNNLQTTAGPGLGQPASAILNCLLAHQLCAEDPSCKSIETVIQHICGSETVACSTTTVTKCQAGLRTLQAFPVFHPTCLCREPSVDPDCNAFRDSLFDHPCMVTTQKERDMYPIHALPTCTHALDVCQKDPSCTRLYNDFREHCKLRSGVCRDKETCYNAWRGLRMTPLFGCFCPGSDQKKCERIYAFIYNNSCVASLSNMWHAISIEPHSLSSWNVSPVSRRARSPINNKATVITSPPNSDDDNKPALLLDTPSTITTRYHQPVTTNATSNTSNKVNSTSTTPFQHEHLATTTTSSSSSSTDRLDDGMLDDDPAASGTWQESLIRQRETDSRQIESRLMDTGLHHHHQQQGAAAAEAGSIDVARFSHFLQSALTRTRIGYHSAASGATGNNNNNGSASSYTASPSYAVSGSNLSTTNHIGGDGDDGGGSRMVAIYQNTCQRALTHCQMDGQCRRHLEPFLRYCSSGNVGGTDTCHRDLCMQALQGFYKDAPLQWSLEVAFCVCKKSQNRNDECLMAQERLHPDCARRPERYHLPVGPSTPMGSLASSPLGTNEASPPHHTPACHHLAEECKAHPDCKPRLEFYVQACAVDVVTKGCAGPPSICRRAVLDILGTDLRTTCSCRATQQLGDVAAMYDCTEWLRLLWLNPCVVEAQRDFHKIQGNLKVVTVPTPTMSPSGDGWTPAGTTVGRETTHPLDTDDTDHMFTVVVPRTKTQRPATSGQQRTPTTPNGVTTDTTASTGSTAGTRFTTGMTTTEMITRPTIPAKFCSLERTNKRIIQFPEGTSKRLYHDDDPDCSELCRCGAGQVVTCSIQDCAQRKPCQTSAAIYAHAATAFQAYRGECLCFSGALVCAKPDPGQYSLPSGVFLFIGYSQADERAIYQFTHTNVSRFLLVGLQRLVYSSFPETSPENECRISIHDQIDENFILQIRLAALDDQRVNNSVTLEMLTHEKAQCLPVANRLRQMISRRMPVIREDETLSVIKVADTVTVLPEPRRSSAGRQLQTGWTIVVTVCWSLIMANRYQHYR